MAAQLPDDFKCPISLEIMSDLVILSSGHTFDRASIQRWLDSGHRTYPITKLPLHEHPSLIPNHALCSLISSYTLVTPSKSFTKRDSALRCKLTESGVVPAVLKCAELDDLSLQQKALSLLLDLSLDDDNKVGLVAEDTVNRVVKVLRVGSPNSRALAATIITSLAVVEVNKATIGAYPDVIWALVCLLIAGKRREKKEAATALNAICSFADNRRRAIDCERCQY
ncbi:hypothetical protein PTKIN_Ptkin16aG0043400 [Pterospermum kingtungense]